MSDFATVEGASILEDVAKGCLLRRPKFSIIMRPKRTLF